MNSYEQQVQINNAQPQVKLPIRLGQSWPGKIVPAWPADKSPHTQIIDRLGSPVTSVRGGKANERL